MKNDESSILKDLDNSIDSNNRMQKGKTNESRLENNEYLTIDLPNISKSKG
jgi:hypothetical protein